MRKTSNFIVMSLLGIGFGGAAGARTSERSAPQNDDPSPDYRYVSLLERLPEEVEFFDPISVTSSGEVCGIATICPEASDCTFHVSCLDGARFRILGEGFAIAGNDKGVLGGLVIEDPAIGVPRAAVFQRGRGVTLLPQLEDEIGSEVLDLNDRGVALVQSFGEETLSFYLYHRGKVTPLPLPPEASQLQLSERGLISGTLIISGGDRAFRFDPGTGQLTVLEPLPTEPNSWGLDINSRGDVLGYSFIFSGLERIGVWRGETFETYFVEGTPEFPTVSNRLLFNESGLIVITDNVVDLDSFLVPRPGVRVPLTTLTSDVPPWTFVIDLNDCGDLVGYAGPARFAIEDVFLLENASPTPGCRRQ